MEEDYVQINETIYPILRKNNEIIVAGDTIICEDGLIKATGDLEQLVAALLYLNKDKISGE